MKESYRDAYGTALIYANAEDLKKGKVTVEELMNNYSQASIDTVEKYLKAMKPLIAGWEADFGKEMMTKGKAWLNMTWSGDAVWAIEEAEGVGIHLDYEVARTAGDVQVMARFVPPYFYRSFEHFSSHRQAPSTHRLSDPAIIRRGNVIYFASPVFAIYNARAPRWCLEMMNDAVMELLGKKMVVHDGPSTLFASLFVRVIKEAIPN